MSVQPLTVELRDDGGRTARGESAALLTRAERRPLDAEAVAGAVGELGGSTVALRRLDLSGLDLGAGAWCLCIMRELWLVSGLGQHAMKHLVRHFSYRYWPVTAWDLVSLAHAVHGLCSCMPVCPAAYVTLCWSRRYCSGARITSHKHHVVMVQCRAVHPAGRDQGRAPRRVGALLRIAAAPCVRHGPRSAAGAARAAGRRPRGP